MNSAAVEKRAALTTQAVQSKLISLQLQLPLLMESSFRKKLVALYRPPHPKKLVQHLGHPS